MIRPRSPELIDALFFNNQISGATGQMKYIGYITPIIFLGLLNGYPSGLNYIFVVLAQYADFQSAIHYH